MITATVITDASYGGVGIAGWAAWVRVDGRPLPIKSSGVLQVDDVGCSGRAEMYAALNGIWLAAFYGAGRVLLRTDCMAVVKVHKGRWRPRWEGALRAAGLQHIQIKMRHVKGHTNDPAPASWVNRWCDREARRQMLRARDEAYTAD